MHPFANAVSSTKVVIVPVPKNATGSAGSNIGAVPNTPVQAPTMIRVNTLPRKKYTGTPNSFADSRTPRRLPSASSVMKTRARGTRLT